MTEVEAVLPRPPGARWGPGVPATLIGSRPMVNGAPGEVARAWLDEEGELHVGIRIEGELAAELTAGMLRGISL